MEPSESYFNRLPKPVNDAAVQYEIPCSCHREDENGKAQCEKQPLMYFPNVMDNTDGEQTRPGNSGMGKRDTHISDDLTDEDHALFKGFVGSNKSHRRKRALSNKRNFTRQNATDYCMEKVSKTDIGKLCATLGINVLEIVTSCSIDLEVKLFLLGSSLTLPSLHFLLLLFILSLFLFSFILSSLYLCPSVFLSIHHPTSFVGNLKTWITIWSTDSVLDLNLIINSIPSFSVMIQLALTSQSLSARDFSKHARS